MDVSTKKQGEPCLIQILNGVYATFSAARFAAGELSR